LNFKLRGACDTAESKLCGVGGANTMELQVSTFKKTFLRNSTTESKLRGACGTAESFYTFIQPKSYSNSLKVNI